MLLKCFLETSDRELYDKIMAGAMEGSGHAAFVAERAELLLQQAARVGLKTRAQCLEYLGSHFRIVLDLPSRLSDMEVGLHLMRWVLKEMRRREGEVDERRGKMGRIDVRRAGPPIPSNASHI